MGWSRSGSEKSLMFHNGQFGTPEKVVKNWPSTRHGLISDTPPIAAISSGRMALEYHVCQVGREYNRRKTPPRDTLGGEFDVKEWV